MPRYERSFNAWVGVVAEGATPQEALDKLREMEPIRDLLAALKAAGLEARFTVVEGSDDEEYIQDLDTYDGDFVGLLDNLSDDEALAILEGRPC